MSLMNDEPDQLLSNYHTHIYEATLWWRAMFNGYFGSKKVKPLLFLALLQSQEH